MGGAVLAWVIVLIGSWTWNRWEAKRGPLPHDISRTTRADVCVLGANALFPDNVTHIQNARRNTLGASPSAKGGRFSLQRRFNCSGGPSGDARKGGTTMNVIASIRNDFQEKFGIPRQSGVVETALSEIIFEPDYRSAEALRGLEGFSHIWLIWAFSASAGKGWSPTVRPPRLGGNARVGVFASRSPFRPNPLGLSAVKLENIVLQSPEGPLLRVSGADLLHGTPILDIKPYLPYADCIPQATGGFAGTKPEPRLEVSAAREVLQGLPAGKWKTLREVLALDPRPSYQDDPERIYGFAFAGRNVRFRVNGSTLEVLSIDAAGEKFRDGEIPTGSCTTANKSPRP